LIFRTPLPPAAPLAGGTAPLVFLKWIVLQDFLGDLARENTKEVLEVHPRLCFDQEMKMISANGDFVNMNPKVAAELLKNSKNGFLVLE